MIRVGITTIPERLPYLGQTIDSLLDQSVKPDLIYVNLPKKDRRGRPYPDYKKDTEHVIINECVDMGPITKLYPLLSISEPDDILILADDDQIYSYHTIESLAQSINKYPAVGFSGRIYRRKELKYITNVPAPTKVTFLETVNAVAYKRWTLKDQTDITDILFRCHEAVYCDDIIIGAILHVKPYVIPYEQQHAQWNHLTNDTPNLFTTNLSGRNDRVYKCIHSL